MVIAILNWTWTIISFFLTGILAVRICRMFLGEFNSTLDEIIAAGAAMCTIYAEAFSAFYRVGTACTLGLILLDAVGAVICRKQIAEVIRRVIDGANTMRGRLFAGGACSLLILHASTIDVRHPDTFLYHAQAIEWTELYGAVKGLGNLFNNFAYNSSILCLQALFSWRGFTGVSIHVTNGLLCVLAVMFFFLTAKTRGKRSLYASDLVRAAAPLYVFYSITGISSPGTDISAMLLMLYLFTKWVEYAEEGSPATGYNKDKETARTAFWGILSVFALSIKLSVAPVVLMCLYPMYYYLRGRKWKELASFIILGTVVVLPFFIRNVIISGYLVYPFPALDIFSFDWKMPASVARQDQITNMVWGRAINFAEDGRSDWPIYKWIVIWWKVQETEDKWLWLADICMLIFGICMVVAAAVKRKFGKKEFILIVAMLSWSYWMYMAPLVRYGFAYFFMLPAVVLLFACNGERVGFAVIESIFTVAMFTWMIDSFSTYNYNLLWPEDYPVNTGETCTIESTDGSEFLLYYPKEGTEEMLDYPGYELFPAVPGKIDTDHLKMRGKDFSEGFRYVP